MFTAKQILKAEFKRVRALVDAMSDMEILDQAGAPDYDLNDFSDLYIREVNRRANRLAAAGVVLTWDCAVVDTEFTAPADPEDEGETLGDILAAALAD